MRRMLALTAVLAAVAVAPAQARVARLPELTSTTVVTADRSGYVDVIVPEDARLSAKVTGNPDVDLEGGGRLVGLWMERQGGYDVMTGTDGLSTLRLPTFLGGAVSTYGSYTPTGRCTGTPEAYPLHYDCTGLPAPQAIVLHEGRYRITVLADGSPLRVTLTLHGLDEGTTTVSPTVALRSVQQPLPPRESLGSQLVTFGTTAPLSGDVATWVLATAKGTSSPVLEEASVCSRADDGAAPPFAYSPHCTGGTSGGYRAWVRAGGEEYGVLGGFVTASSEPSTAPVGLGGSFGDSGGVSLGQTLGVWLEHRPA